MTDILSKLKSFQQMGDRYAEVAPWPLAGIVNNSALFFLFKGVALTGGMTGRWHSFVERQLILVVMAQVVFALVCTFAVSLLMYDNLRGPRRIEALTWTSLFYFSWLAIIGSVLYNLLNSTG